MRGDNPEELFDIVDENDVVIGQEMRGIVHRDKLLHRAIHILLVNDNGDYFLQKRSKFKDSAPQKWDSSASGHLDAGESYTAAAIRELSEELGVNGVALEEIGSLSASERTGMEFVRIYQGHYNGDFVLHPNEIESGEWFSIHYIDKWIHDKPEEFARCFLDVWDCSRARNKTNI